MVILSAGLRQSFGFVELIALGVAYWVTLCYDFESTSAETKVIGSSNQSPNRTKVSESSRRDQKLEHTLVCLCSSPDRRTQ